MATYEHRKPTQNGLTGEHGIFVETKHDYGYEVVIAGIRIRPCRDGVYEVAIDHWKQKASKDRGRTTLVHAIINKEQADALVAVLSKHPGF
jgi:hypothetical protein